MGMTTSPRSFKYLNGKIFILVIVLLAFRIEAGDVCNEGCPDGATKTGKLAFKTGDMYTYDFKSDIKIYLSDTQEKTMAVTGAFQVYAQKNCNYAMKLTSLQVKGPDRSAIRAGADLQVVKLVRFTLSNDELSSEICAQADDTEFGLNVKRALISMLQSADYKSYETDVFGTCPTIFSKSQSGDTTTVTKTRDLNRCGHRESLTNGLITGVINDNSGVKSTPLLNGNYVCEQKFKNGILENVQLTEDYSYVPFSNGQAGAKVKVTTSVKKVSEQTVKVPDAGPGIPRTLLFENPKPQTIAKFGATIEKVLKATLDTYHGQVGDNSAAKFSELIRIMQYAKKDELTQLFSKVKAGTVDSNKDLTRKIYLDALFRTGTSDSMEANIALLNEFNAEEMKIAYMSFNMVRNVNKESLPSIAKLLDAKTSYPKGVYLSLGTLLNKYCRKYGCSATDTKNIFDKFIRKLNQCKANTHEEESMVVAVLKGVRNTQHLSPPIIHQLIQCTGEKKSTRIRVAALDTFTAAACDSSIQNAALALLKNREEDSEIRIEAYLAYVACPSGTVANEIKKLLDTETVYQVGSFITSHLAALRSTADPTRQAAKQYFENVRTTQKFPSDLRRYSFNREFSYQIGSAGVGASFDSNVIYSQRSFVPRSARFNLTGEIFGSSFNIFEFNGRQENLDLVLESRFGPKGLFNSANAKELYDLFFEEGKQRERRSIRNDVKQFAKSVNMGNDVNSDVDLDVSFKMFGSEMYFMSLGDNLSTDPKKFLNDVRSKIREAFTFAKNFNYKYENHALFLDAELVYPTGVGMPLKLSTIGTGVVKVEAAGKVDFKAMQKDPKNSKFNLKLVPSYNFEIKSAISVDGFSSLTGLQVTGNVHSSTGFSVDFKLSEGGKGFDFNLRFPVTRQEILKFDHKVVFVLQERGKERIDTPVKFTTKSNTFNGCFDQLNEYLGMTFCTDYSISTPQPGGANFPLNGENFVHAYANVDAAYKFSARINDENPKLRSIEFTFDTPGSAVNRQSSLKLEAGTDPKYFARVSLKSPIRTASVEAGFNNDNKELVLYVDAINGNEKYNGQLGFTKSGTANRQEYTPILAWNTPSSTQDKFFGYKLTGKVIVDKKTETAKRYNFNNLELIGYEQPIALNGWVDLDVHKLVNDLKLTVGTGDVNLVGNLEYRRYYLDFDYGLTTNLNEMANGKFAFNLDVDPEKYFSNKYVFVYGRDLQSQAKRVEFFHRYDYELNENKTIMSLKIAQNFKAPIVPIDYSFNGEFNKNLAKYDLTVAYQKQSFGSKLAAKMNLKTFGDYDVNFGVSLNANNIDLFMKRDIEGAKSKINNRLTTSAGTKVELNGHVGHVVNSKNVDINLEGVLVPAENQDPYKLNLVVLVTAKKLSSNAKIFAGSTELSSYNINVDKDDRSMHGAIDLKARDILEGSGSFKSSNGKGDGNILLSFTKIDRKVKVTSSFHMLAPIYDMKTDIFYHFGKEDDKKITVETKNRVTPVNFDSKNTVEVQGDKYSFNSEGTTTGRVTDGKTYFKYHLTLPNGREMSGDIEREMKLKQETTGNGNIQISFKDVLPTKKTRSLLITGTLSDTNLRSGFFNLVHKITYADFDGRDVVLSTNFKNVPKGEFKNAAAELNVRGTLLPEVIDFKISADEYCREHAVYSASAKYGGQFNYNLNGNYYVGGGKKPTTYDFKAIINVPNTKINSVNFQSNGKFIVPETETDQYEAQCKVSGTFSSKVFAIDTTLKGNNKGGSGNLNVNVPDMDPFSTDGSYSSNIGDVNSDVKGNLNIHYGKGKNFAVTAETKVADSGNDVAIMVGLKTPFEQGKNVDFTYKRVTSGSSNTIRAEMKADDKKYSLTSDTSFTTTNPKVDVMITYPGHPDVRFVFDFKNLGDHKYSSKLNMENFGEFNYVSSMDGTFQSVENYHLVIDIDSPKIGANKVHGEISSKKGGKGVDVKITENGKNLVSGSADFTVQDQNGKLEIGGQGDVKFYDKQTTGNFKFVRTNFDEKQHKETGFKVVLNGNVDSKKLVAEFKWTNKNLHIQNSICQDNSKCSTIQITSAIDRTDFDYKHNLVVAIDLGSFGFNKDFLLTSTTDGSGFYVKHHLFDMQLKSKNAILYQFKVDVKPVESSVHLTFPTREVVLEYIFKLPKELFGKYDIRTSFYFDKRNSPKNVAALGITADIGRMGNNGVRASYTLKFTHPTIRELKVFGKSELSGDNMYATGELTFDVFKNPNQAIVFVSKYNNLEADPLRAFNVSSEFSITSKGLSFDYGFSGHAACSFDRRQVSVGGSLKSPIPSLQAGIYFATTGDSFEVAVSAFNEKVIQADGTYDPAKRNGKVMATLKYLNSPPFIFEGSSNGLSSVKGSFKRDRLMDAKGEVTLNKEASLSLNSQGKQLFRAKVALDSVHFLESEYKVDDVQIKDFTKNARMELKNNFENSKEEISKRLADVRQGLESQMTKIKDAVPDFDNFAETYKKEGQKVVDELKEDENVKKVIEFYKRFYETVGKSIEDVVTTIAQYIKKVGETLSAFYNEISQSFQEKLLPALQETYSNLERIIFAFSEEAVRFIVDVIQRTAAKMKAFESDFTKIGVSVSEQFKKIAAFLNQYFDTIRKEANDFYEIVIDNMKALPAWDDIKKKMAELFGQYFAPEQITQVVKAVSTFLQEIIPIDQIDTFIVNVEEYIENKLAKKAVNDVDELKKIAVSFLEAIRATVGAIRTQFGEMDVSKGGQWFPIPFSFDSLKRIPALANIQFSPWNYLRHEKFQSLRDMFFTYRPFGWNPRHFLPPFDKQGSIVDGQHIFTFDGRHMTFPGTCDYILAQDFINNNFSVVVTLDGGKMKSMTLVDKDNSLTVSAGGVVKFNDKATDLPVHQGDIHAWRQYYTVSFLSESGVFVQCALDLRVCHITVNGYYHGKLRGVLGNGNGEPYDDFALPSGKIATTFEVFGNAYKTTSTCPDVSFDEHKNEKGSEECASVFGADSSMKYCNYIVDPRPYMEACEHAVHHSTDKNDAACNIALAYASSCRMENLLTSAPSKCVQCSPKRAVGEKYTETAPKKSANVVFVVDLELGAQTLSDLVQPAINILRNQLKARDFAEKNVKIAVIGYRDDLKYSHLFTTNGKIDFTGKLTMPADTHMIKDEAPPLTGNADLDKGLQQAFTSHKQMQDDLGLGADGRAFQEAFRYPFQSTAGRAIVAFRSDQLSHSKNPTRQVGGTLMNALTKRAGIAVHMIGPVEDLKLNNEKNNKIVGFNSDSVLMLGKNKATEAREKVTFESTLGIDLVQANKGYTFSLNNFNETKDKKAFIQQMTGAIADDLARTEYKFECECELRYGLFAYEKCHQVESKILPPIVKTRG